jgi:hypothetical protein
MATGDQADMLRRAKAVLPASWFPSTASGQASQSPVLDGIMAAGANLLASVYSLLQLVIQQTRIATATGVWLDIVSLDFFGGFLPRRPGESDASFRARIKAELFRPKGTRAAIIKTVTDLTGRAPSVFEPARPADCGTYGGPLVGYGAAGGYGSLVCNNQFFVTVHSPVAWTSGVGADGYGGSIGGYGAGAIEYTDIALFSGGIANANVYAAIADVTPAGYIAWTQILTS